MACRLGRAAALNHITAGKEEIGQRRGGNEMKELQMRDFPVRRINQQKEQHSSKPGSQAADQSRAKHTHTLHYQLCMHETTVVTSQSRCTYICAFTPSNTGEDVKRHIVNWL
ncbi:hypothetical protein CesoFtcFv8_021839 [Champsocephalus esox]|uniref:Uncharacterized protein n=1 Tax=Champsocephalus esox TaxID=159716 RepID=A0AAN8GJ68_9TELE|nr:hypothetical protein CesoFtcFv8_021839 [Champsocephalus esox]